MIEVYRLKHQYENMWYEEEGGNEFSSYTDDPQGAKLFTDIEEVYKFIDNTDLEVMIEIIYCGKNV